MDYVKKRFEDLPSRATPVMAADLNNMGAGIEYSVQGVDRLTDSVALKVNAADVYSRAEVDAAVSPKANSADVYTKAETFSRAETGTQITSAITASRPPLYGTGFPNGVVAAPVGTLYADEAVTNGASLWQKISGTGSTGWVVVRGDTGVRHISSLIMPNWTLEGVLGATLSVQRVGTRVTVVFTGASVASETYSELVPLPTGFTPPSFGVFGSGYQASEGFPAISAGVWSLIPRLSVGPAPIPAGVQASVTASFITPDAWPSTLPGTN